MNPKITSSIFALTMILISTIMPALASSNGIYAIGGIGSSGSVATVEAYDPLTDKWTTVAPLPVATESLAAATDSSGNIYAIGGAITSGAYTNAVYKYTPSTNSWTTVASLPAKTSLLAAATDSSGNIYAIGGALMGVKTDSVYKYTTTNSWSSVASMPSARSHLAATSGLLIAPTVSLSPAMIAMIAMMCAIMLAIASGMISLKQHKRPHV